MKHSLVIVGLVSSLWSARAHADSTRYQCTGPTTGPVRVIANESCRGFRTGTTEVLFPRMASGTLMTSTDGRTVVMIEDYLSGTRSKDNKTITADYDVDLIVNPVVLQIYRDGKRVGFHDIKRLLGTFDSVESSISHVRWVKEMPKDIGATFELTVVGDRRYVFDSVTGKMLTDTGGAKRQ